MEENKMPLEKIPFVLRGVMEESIEIVSFHAEQKGLKLICDLDKAAPTLVIGDQARLRKTPKNHPRKYPKLTENRTNFCEFIVEQCEIFAERRNYIESKIINNRKKI